jgi:late competence protein required for DNA uptake (superfamily II DNA/RNA helicase)
MDTQKVPGQMVLPPAPSSVFYHELAADFIEQQVGRQRWRENLAAMVQQNNLRPALTKWMQTMNIQAKPELVLVAISDMLKRETGKWR